MFTLKFHKSRSKKYKDVEKMLPYMNDHTFDGVYHTVTMSVREIYQKWNFFNRLFWTTVDWKGTAFGFDGMCYHDHSDKTRIFYAIQLSHSTWMCFSINFLSYLNMIYSGKLTIDQAREFSMKEYDMELETDKFLELYQTLKSQIEYQEAFNTTGPYVIPRQCSYYQDLRFENKLIKAIKENNENT